MKKLIISLISLTLCANAVNAVNAAQYSDISGHWAEDIISAYSDREIIKGADGLFRPDDSMTRGEFCVILDRIFKYENSSENIFSDLDDNYYTSAILKANEAGVINGYENKIRPNDNITREEAAVMLCRAYDIDTADFSGGEADGVSVWAADAMYTLMNDKILSGNSLNELRAYDNITRAEALKIINGIEEKYNEKMTEATESPEPAATESPEPAASESPEPAATESPKPAPAESSEPEVTQLPVPEKTVEPEAEPTEEVPEITDENQDADAENDEDKKIVTVYIDAANAGVDMLSEPAEIEIKEGSTAAAVIDEFLSQAGYTYNATGDLLSGFYISSISGLDAFEFVLPETVKAYLEEQDITYRTEQNEPGTLGEFDFTDRSGWIYFVNDEKADMGMSEYNPENGDVIALKFTLDYGNDL